LMRSTSTQIGLCLALATLSCSQNTAVTEWLCRTGAAWHPCSDRRLRISVSGCPYTLPASRQLTARWLSAVHRAEAASHTSWSVRQQTEQWRQQSDGDYSGSLPVRRRWRPIQRSSTVYTEVPYTRPLCRPVMLGSSNLRYF